jgi:hypothetical protein
MNKPESEVTAAVVDSLFRRIPSLVGFSVQEAASRELVVMHVETDPWPALKREISGEIAGTLFELMEEEPAARELLLGRTFARMLH